MLICFGKLISLNIIRIFRENQEMAQETNLELLPSHVFRIFLRCDDKLWHINGMNCRNSNSTRILAFILPNDNRDLNCLVSFLNLEKIKVFSHGTII